MGYGYEKGESYIFYRLDVRRGQDRQDQQHECAGQTVAQGGGYELLTPEC